MKLNFKKIFSKNKNKNKKKYPKLKWFFHRLIFIFVVYLVLIIFAQRIVTIFTFPSIYYNVQEFTWYIKTDLDFEEINIKTQKGENINWLYVDSKSDKTIYYFHWNWWPLSFFYSEIKYLSELWYNVLAYDYPWYWKSTGFPYKDTVYDFSETFFNHIKQEKGIKEEELIVWWYSIWTAVATDFVYKHDVSKLVLVAPLSSRFDMSKSFIWFTAQKILFLKDSFISYKKVRDINIPTLIIHWNADKIIPFTQWKKVFNYSNSKNKYFIELDDFGHNYIISVYGKILKNHFSDFLNKWELSEDYFFIDEKAKKLNYQIVSDQEYINSQDLYLDSSLTRFVNNRVPFDELSYVPDNLEKIKSEYVFDAKWWTQLLRSDANLALQKMAKDFYTEYWTKLKIVSAYRSYKYQQWIKNRGCPDNLCAKAGYSEHQSWLAVDISEASTNYRWKTNKALINYSRWLNENAYKYGFHNTYQKGLEIDGYEIEPWHWRYMGVFLAKYLKDKDITIAEFYKQKKN